MLWTEREKIKSLEKIKKEKKRGRKSKIYFPIIRSLETKLGKCMKENKNNKVFKNEAVQRKK